MRHQCTLVLDHTAQEGGAELALVRLATALRARGDDVRVLLFAHGPIENALASAGVPARVRSLAPGLATASRDEIAHGTRLLSSVIAAAGFVPKLAAAIRASNADLVVANSLKAAVFASLAAPLSGRVWAWHIHDRLAADYLPRRLLVLMCAIATLGPRMIVVNSWATLATLPRRARRKAVVAYPGLVDESFVSGLPDTPPVIGIVGRISPTKGQQLFVEAAGEIARQHPDVRFRVVGAALFGEEEYEASVRAGVGRLGLGDRFEFTGWVHDATEQIARLHVLVHASPVPEPFGQVVVEALAASVPVVAVEAGGVAEILDQPGCSRPLTRERWRRTALGVLVAPGDHRALAEAVTDVLDNPGQARHRAERASADVRERFSISRTADVVAGAWARARLGHRAAERRRTRETAN